MSERFRQENFYMFLTQTSSNRINRIHAGQRGAATPGPFHLMSETLFKKVV